MISPGETPAALGYRMPAEWEPQRGVWFTWPRRNGISFPDKYDTVPPVYAALVRHLIDVGEVNINVWDAAMEAEARRSLNEHGAPADRVHFHEFPAYEPWCRDHGPIFVTRDTGLDPLAVVDWRYNAWGDKYPPYDLDDDIPKHIAKLRGCPLFTPDVVMEGGSIEVNGRGSLLTTESCLLNPNRNPDLSKQEIETALKENLGVTNILWLGDGIAGDDTDGHIDDMTRFVDETTIVTAVEPNPDDANHAPLADNLARLRSMRDQDGNPFRIVELPMPAPVHHDGERLPASYANFYIANDIVLVPTYRCAKDAEAVDILRNLFKSRTVLGIDSTELVWGLGSFHCISQQEPAPRRQATCE